MRVLLDTNILLSLQLVEADAIERATEPASRLLGQLRRRHLEVFVHPAAEQDLARDPNVLRRRARTLLLEGHRRLEAPPGIPAAWQLIWPGLEAGSNDAVDLGHLAALHHQAVDLLVTEDAGLRRRARRVGLGERTLTAEEALALLRDLFPEAPSPPPAVEFCRAYSLDPQDPIFDSFRADYSDFDGWFDRCRRDHRPVWVVRSQSGRLAAFALVKDSENEPPAPLSGKVVKICSFKVADDSLGLRLGELLLKAVFDHAHNLRADWLFLSAFPHHEKLIELLEDFGFRSHEARTARGELVLSKPLRPSLLEEAPLDALAQHIRFGPPHLPAGVPWYLVPIEPRFAEVLFPDCQVQRALLPGSHPFGNAIRKAYLSRSSIRELAPGSVLAFYGSRVARAIFALGVVESTFRSTEPEEIARRVGRRTVYSFEEISRLCSVGPVLALLFRYAERLVKPISYEQLLSGRVLQGPPQSIQSVPQEGIEWLLHHRA